MKPWNRFGLRPAIGLVIDQQQIAMSVVATTPFGRREVASDLQQCDEQPPEAVLARMLEPWIPAAGAKRAKARPWIQIGLPESQVFQATVAITPTNRLYTPQNFFLEAVQSTNLRAEDRTIDLLKLELDKQPLACLSACPRSCRRPDRDAEPAGRGLQESSRCRWDCSAPPCSTPGHPAVRS